MTPLSPAILGLGRGSSFSVAFRLLKGERRRGMQVFYAFCRAVDDAADEAATPAQGRALLARWRSVLAGRARPPLGELEGEVLWFMGRFGVPRALLAEVVAGAASDLRPKVRMAARRDLDRYCHQVAGAVGQACLPLFNAPLAEGRAFAEALGRALQLTNIIRDAGEDAALGRVYFAQEDLRRHRAREADLLAGRSTPALQALFADYAGRAAAQFAEARQLARGLPHADLRPAWIMAAVYEGLLAAMRADGLQVLHKRYRAGRWLKLRAVLRHLF